MIYFTIQGMQIKMNTFGINLLIEVDGGNFIEKHLYFPEYILIHNKSVNYHPKFIIIKCIMKILNSKMDG